MSNVKIQISDLQFSKELANDRLTNEITLTKEQISLIMGGASLTPSQAATCTLMGGAVAASFTPTGPAAPLAGAIAAAGCILVLGSDSPSSLGNISDMIAA